MNKIWFFAGFFFLPIEKLHPSLAIFCLFSPHNCNPMSHFRLLCRPLLSPSLPVVHSSGWEWTSQLAPLKETHISGCSPFCICHFPFGWNMAPVSALAEYITVSLSLCIPTWLCCHCYHVAVQVRKGLSGYSSHYWLLNLVMVVKALPVPPCLRGQLMACFMSLQRRASLLGHRLVHTPSPSTLHPRGWLGGTTERHPFVPFCWANLSPPKKASRVPYYSSEAWRPFVICDSRLYEVTRLAWPTKWKQQSFWGWQEQFSKFMAHFKKLSFFTIP